MSDSEQKPTETDELIKKRRQTNLGGGFRKRAGDTLHGKDIMDKRQRRGNKFHKRQDDETEQS
jgi:hypothetical protein